MKPLLVGEANPHSADPRHALLPWPAGGAGTRLCAILGLGSREYLRRFDRVNLLDLDLDERWNIADAREAARDIHRSRRVLLGARVCAAHGVLFRPFAITWSYDTASDVLVLPYPSGCCRIWNDPRSTVRTRSVVGQFLRARAQP